MMRRPVFLVMVAERAGMSIPPFPLLYVGSALKKAGYRVILRHIIPDDIDKTVAEITGDNPLWVGFSVLTGLPTLHSSRMSRLIKAAREVPIVWGGVHPSLLAEQCCREQYIDYVVVGEGEVSAVELSEALEGRRSVTDIRGIVYKDRQGNCVKNQRHEEFIRLEDYPLDFGLLDFSRYISKEEITLGGKTIQVRSLGYCASRGCPHDCGFCYNREFNRRRWRGPSAEFVINDIRRFREEFDITKIHFWDDNFFTNPKRAMDILEAIDMSVGADVRIDYLNEATARALHKNKVVFLLIGVESGSDRILNSIQKGFNVERIYEGARLLNEYAVPALYSAILGLPTETQSEFRDTIHMLLRLREIHRRASFTVGMYLPYPGTNLYRRAIEKGFSPPSDTQGWYVIDRWHNKVPLPWVDQDVCRNVRHLFFFLTSAPWWMRWWAGLRLRRMWLSFGVDIKVYIVFLGLWQKFQSGLVSRLRRWGRSRRAIIETFIGRHGVRRFARLKCRILGVPDIGMFSRMSYFVRLIRKFGIEASLRANPSARILDAGCGDGLYSMYLSRMYPFVRIDACDTSEASVDDNKGAADRMGLRTIHFSVCDLIDIESVDRYDLVLCIAVLVYRSHQENIRMLQKLRQSLKAGGKAYFFLTHGSWEQARVIPGRLYPKMYKVFCTQNCGQMYTLDVFTGLLREAGFEVIHARIVAGFWGQLAWEIDKVFKEHGAERLKFLVLPVLKAMVLVDIWLENRKGTGMVFIVEKPVKKDAEL